MSLMKILLKTTGFFAFTLVPGHLFALTLTSPAFQEGGAIPVRFTALGQDISPPLAWSDAPQGTRSFALICEDPDAPAGTWIHWTLYNIPGTFDHIDEGGRNLPSYVAMGTNSWGRETYGGPNPPSGTHHYHFTLYALDRTLEKKGSLSREQLARALEKGLLAKATLTGLFSAPQEAAAP